MRNFGLCFGFGRYLVGIDYNLCLDISLDIETISWELGCLRNAAEDVTFNNFDRRL